MTVLVPAPGVAQSSGSQSAEMGPENAPLESAAQLVIVCCSGGAFRGGYGEQNAVYVKGGDVEWEKQRESSAKEDEQRQGQQQQQQESRRSQTSGEGKGKGALSSSSPPRTLNLACRTPD